MCQSVGAANQPHEFGVGAVRSALLLQMQPTLLRCTGSWTAYARAVCRFVGKPEVLQLGPEMLRLWDVQFPFVYMS